MARRYGRGGVSAVLAAVAVAGVSACERGGSGGSTTIIQTVAPTSASAAPTSTTPSASPINDPKRLCSLAEARAQELVTAADAFWSLIQQPGWSFGDPDISGAADHVTEVANKVIPILEGSVGPSAPEDISGGVGKFVKSAKEFAQAIGERAPNEDLVRFGKAFKASIDALNHGCGY